MSFATVIILFLLIATIVGGWFVGATLIRNIKGTSTSSGGGGTSSTSSSPSTASSSPTPAGNSGGNWLMPTWLGPTLLAIALLWLILRIIIFKGAPEDLEATFAVIIPLTGACLVKKEMRFSGFILSGIIIFMVLFPRVMTGLQGIRQSQLKPAPVEQVAPPPEEVPLPSTERVVVSGKKITLTGDGTYSVPKGRKSLCFTHLGMKNGSSSKSQYLTLNKVEYSALGRECHDLPEDLGGKVVVDFFPGKKWGDPSEVKKLYARWKSQPGGQSEWPVIRLGE